MYRFLLAILLCHSVTSAPQSLSDSDITYVKQQPPSEAPAAPFHHRESRIENLPLTIPGTSVTLDTGELGSQVQAGGPEAKKLPGAVSDDLTDSETLVGERSELSESVVLPDSDRTFTDSNLPINLSEETAESSNLANSTDLSRFEAERNHTVPEITAEENGGKGALSEDNVSERSDLTDELLEPHDLADTLPAETSQSELRRGRTYESGETTDIFEEATERYDEKYTQVEIEPPRTRATPKFVPKLSYSSKPKAFVSFPTNSIERAGKRRFRSNCRCEKIWNCPKLQITVPRCPDEYFLCCF